MQGEKAEICLGHVADQPRWERVFFNSNRGYSHYRFQDFVVGCAFRDSERNCAHKDNEAGGGGDGLSVCACDFCPMVQTDIDAGDETDYSEGEQPVLVLYAEAALR